MCDLSQRKDRPYNPEPARKRLRRREDMILLRARLIQSRRRREKERERFERWISRAAWVTAFVLYPFVWTFERYRTSR